MVLGDIMASMLASLTYHTFKELTGIRNHPLVQIHNYSITAGSCFIEIKSEKQISSTYNNIQNNARMESSRQSLPST